MYLDMYNYYYTGETLPYITPDGYNASLGQDPVEFRCVVPSKTFIVNWVINGEPLQSIGEERSITVEATAENDNITLECLAVFRDTAPASSGEIMLHIQGDHNIKFEVTMLEFLRSNGIFSKSSLFAQAGLVRT